MGRGRVEVKRIENKLNRQVTFAKRRNGILKKAYELSVLCDAEVALVVFSTSGKLYEYCSSPSMLKTIDRYQKCSYGLEASQPVNENQQNCYHEYLRLKARVDVLQQSQRNLLGQDLGTLNTNELEQLELQVEMSLKQIRSRKTRFMLDEIADLQRREQMLAEANKVLRRKMEESATEFPLRLSWEAGGHQNIPHNHQSAQLEGFFPPLGLNSTLQMGYNPVDSEGHMHVSAPSHHHSHGFFPEWMP